MVLKSKQTGKMPVTCVKWSSIFNDLAAFGKKNIRVGKTFKFNSSTNGKTEDALRKGILLNGDNFSRLSWNGKFKLQPKI